MRIAMPCSGRVPIPPVTYGARHLFELVRSLRELGHVVELMNDRNGSSEAGHLASLPRAIDRFDADAVHVNQSEVALALGILGPSFFFTPWAFEWYQKPHSDRWYELTGAMRDKWALRLSDVIVAPTEASKEMLESYGYGPVEYIPHSIDTGKFKAKGTGDPKLALGIGQVHERKRWDLAAIGLKGTGIRLRIIGPERDPALGKRLREMGVDVTGEVSEERLLAELEGCGFVVHPAAHEGFPGAVLEALSFSRPVVVSGSQAHIKGTIAPGSLSDEPEDVIKTVHDTAIRFASDEAEMRRIGREARRLVVENYDRMVIAKQHIRVYEMYGAS